MKWLNTSESVAFDESDVAFIKVAVHRQAEQLITKAKDIETRLSGVSQLSSHRKGYWKKVEGHWSDSYIICTLCGKKVDGSSWNKEWKTHMAMRVKNSEIPCYCGYCGSKNVPALTPSEYFNYLSISYMGEERRYKMDEFFEKVTRYMDEINFVVYDHSNEEEALLAYEEKAGEGNFPLFDVEGGVIYG